MHSIFLNEEIKMILTQAFIDQYTAIKTHHLVFLCSAGKKETKRAKKNKRQKISSAFSLNKK